MLCLMFGVVCSACSLFLRLERHILLIALNSDENEAVCMPTTEAVVQFKASFVAMHNTFGNV